MQLFLLPLLFPKSNKHILCIFCLNVQFHLTWVPSFKSSKCLTLDFDTFHRTDFGGFFSMLLDWPFLPKWRWKQFCCNYFDVEPRKWLDWLDYSTTVAGNKKSPKMHAWKCLKKTSRHSATKHPTAWRPVLWRSRYYVSIKFDFSLLLQYWFLKIHHRLFFSLSRRYLTFLVFQ